MIVTIVEHRQPLRDAGVIVQRLRQKLRHAAKALADIGDKGGAVAVIQAGEHRAAQRVDDMRAGKHVPGIKTRQRRGVDLGQRIEPRRVGTAGRVSDDVALVEPLAAQHRGGTAEHIAGRQRTGQENIIVEIDKAFGQPGDAPQQAFDGE